MIYIYPLLNSNSVLLTSFLFVFSTFSCLVLVVLFAVGCHNLMLCVCVCVGS